MNNITSHVEKGKLYLCIDLTQDLGATKGGKGMNIAKTKGYENVPALAGHAFNLHVYRRAGTRAVADATLTDATA